MNALGGIPACIDPTVEAAGKTIAGTVLDLMSDQAALKRAQDEFRKRKAQSTDSGPWCDFDPPIDFPWPEYVVTPRGREWWIPATAADRGLAR
jgi:aminobenzoyl-glutamate utilization protein B